MRAGRPNHLRIDRASLQEVPPSRIFLDEAMISPQRSGDIVVQCELTVREYRASVAILPDRMGVVRHENNVRTRRALAERLGAFSTKALVTDLRYLVDQVDIKVDGKTGRESEPRSHARRVGVDPHFEIFGELGECLDIVDRAPDLGSIDPSDEGDVLAAGESAVKRAREEGSSASTSADLLQTHGSINGINHFTEPVTAASLRREFTTSCPIRKPLPVH